jgi:hypothetical protein
LVKAIGINLSPVYNYFVKVFTKNMPKPAAPIHKKTFSKIFNEALSTSPCWNNNKESNEKVEKVVNAPKKPTPKSVL